LIHGFSKHLDDAILSQDIGSLDALTKEYQMILERYYQSAKGPMKQEIAAKFLAEKPLDHARKVFK